MNATDTEVQAEAGNAPLPQLLTADQVADMICVSKRTMFRLVKAGRLPAPTRFSRKLVRWNAAAVRAALELL